MDDASELVRMTRFDQRQEPDPSHALAPRDGIEALRDEPDFVIGFEDPGCVQRSLVGGKGANLGKLVRAGLPVPQGYVISTRAYDALLDEGGLREEIRELTQQLDYLEPGSFEQQTNEIRERIMAAQPPAAIVDQIAAAYQALTADGLYVAVRSSATTEDMAAASFAGLHDTFLDVNGFGDVLASVSQCWASLWTARCAAYREGAGLDHDEASIAVVVQVMVLAEVAGVLFTANPVTAATNEYVVNASYSLGESVVSGMITPDQFVVDGASRELKSRFLGTKEHAVVRQPSGSGTQLVDVEPARRARFCLNELQLRQLVELGATVMALYGGLPQDIEWALADGHFYLLQARDITGVEFTWDEAMETWQSAPEDPSTVWSHAYAETSWTGAITPLFYTIRARHIRDADHQMFRIWGFDDLLQMRRYRYRRGTMYYSSVADRIYHQRLLPRRLRKYYLGNLPPEWREEAAQARWDIRSAVKMHVRTKLLAGSRHGPFRFFESTYAWIDKSDVFVGPTAEQLSAMSDAELKREAERSIVRFRSFNVSPRTGFWVYSPFAFGVLREMLDKWARGPTDVAFQEIISGLPQRTAMLEESIAVWELARVIRESLELTTLLRENPGVAFFERCQETGAGRDFLSRYERFVRRWEHRGHADRDLWFPRRSEDPAIDARALLLLVEAKAPSPEAAEQRLVAAREQATAAIVTELMSTRFGLLKVAAFRWVQNYALRFLVLRDDQRDQNDRNTMAKKRVFAEVGRRVCKGSSLEGDDFYFLAERELWQLFDHPGVPADQLTRIKIRNRRHAFEAVRDHDEAPPMYLYGNTPVESPPGSFSAEGTLAGATLSRGVVRGTARVLRRLEEIDRLERGDILVCHGTDPGWASVFSLISGLVMETGGMLSHGACLSREYGLPAVTVPNAISIIPDGAEIELNSDLGTVTVTSNRLTANSTGGTNA